MARSANSLHDRADELMMFDVIGHVDVDSSLPPLNVSFLSSTALDTDTGNLIGSIIEEGLFDVLTILAGAQCHCFDSNIIKYRI